MRERGRVLALLRERTRALDRQITMERLMPDTASKAGLPGCC